MNILNFLSRITFFLYFVIHNFFPKNDEIRKIQIANIQLDIDVDTKRYIYMDSDTDRYRSR